MRPMWTIKKLLAVSPAARMDGVFVCENTGHTPSQRRYFVSNSHISSETESRKQTGSRRSTSSGDKPKRRFPWKLTVFLLFLLWLGVNFYISNQVLEVTRYDVSLQRLPPAFEGLKVVLLADLHGKVFGPENTTLFEMVAAEKPDLIALAGDFVESNAGLSKMRSLCLGLQDIAPTYYVTGNHEWAARMVPQTKALLQETNVTMLQNQFVYLQKGEARICLAGVDDPNGPWDMPSVMDVVRKARAEEDGFVLLLSHRYDRLDTYAQANVDLVLSGHAHGGILRLPFTEGLIGPGRNWFPTNTAGVIREQGTVMVVSRGLGSSDLSSLPLRMFNQPEIVSITLHTEVES